MLLNPGLAGSQTFPEKPIRFVTTGVASGGDAGARLVAQALTANIGQQVVVDNRPSGVIPGQVVAKAAPDGYTVLFYGASVWIMPLLQSDTGYDALRDFAPITKVGTSPNVIAVHPSLPVKTLQELIALAKAKPGALNYASLGTGTATHLAAELFKSMAGVNITRVAYKNGATQMSDLIGGHVQMAVSNASSVAQHVKSGRLRGLAVTTAQPTALAPGLPTATASGVPGYESGALYCMFAPAKTPPAIIARLNQETVRALRQPDVKEQFFTGGVDIIASTPEEMAATMTYEIARLGKLIKEAGIRGE